MISNVSTQPMISQTISHAKRIWDYLASFSKPEPSDAIVVCCSYDLRVCDYACELMQASFAPVIVFSGNRGNWTSHLWEQAEAHVFSLRAEENGINTSSMLIEAEASNLGENIAFSRSIIPEAETVTFITKPNTILRVKLTVPIQWPGVRAQVACPAFSFPDEISNVIGLFGVINEMVGDIERIIKYPKIGYQIEHELPKEVLESWEYLVRKGFTQHMIKSKQLTVDDASSGLKDLSELEASGLFNVFENNKKNTI